MSKEVRKGIQNLPENLAPHLEQSGTLEQVELGNTLNANTYMIGGTHYQDIDGEQHWDRVARLQLDYFQGQITKYVERWKKKNGLEDLKKAQHFLQKYIELIEAGHDFRTRKTGDTIYTTGREVSVEGD